MTTKTTCELDDNHSSYIDEALQGNSGRLNGIYRFEYWKESTDWDNAVHPLIVAGQYGAVSAMYGMFELCYLGREEEF